MNNKNARVNKFLTSEEFIPWKKVKQKQSNLKRINNG